MLYTILAKDILFIHHWDILIFTINNKFYLKWTIYIITILSFSSYKYSYKSYIIYLICKYFILYIINIIDHIKIIFKDCNLIFKPMK